MKAHFVEEFDLPTKILYTTDAELEADAEDAVKWAIDCDRLMGL